MQEILKEFDLRVGKGEKQLVVGSQLGREINKAMDNLKYEVKLNKQQY